MTAHKYTTIADVAYAHGNAVAAWCARDYWDSHDTGHTWAAITSLFTWRDLTGAAKDEYPPRPGEVREEA